MMHSVKPEKEGVDEFQWRLNPDGCFSVASISMLLADSKEVSWLPSTVKLLKLFWNSLVPFKIQIFMWRVCIDRLPTKDSLSKRGVLDISSNLLCEFCKIHLETSTHFFFLCNVVKALWRRIYLWLGEDLPFSLAKFFDFGIIQEKVKNVKSRKKINSIWIATAWSLWIMRNAMIFDKVAYSFDKVFYNIMFLSWSWLDSSNSLLSCSFYDWYKLPLDCFNDL
ncbi:uncharacterized protein LOC131604302 [Vicia villosa]|uniref:uncharacterized protein LOC131604302 n=1 Tax=Vicia villosa TaxID=3911 RepID=UPI00273BA51E|nr:uncharacterized protein LOC131604302 [Vicia villosa]